MSELMSYAVTALRVDQAKLEQIGRNTANATTPGYRRQMVASTLFDNMMSTQEQVSSNASTSSGTNGGPSVLPMTSLGVDLSKGALQATGRELDVAVEGTGFLVLSEGGKEYLTSAGSLRVSEDGYLVGQAGLRVQGLHGDIRIDGSGTLAINPLGVLTVAGQEIATLQVKIPARGQRMGSQDGLLMSVEDGALGDAPHASYTVRAGFLETSNAVGPRESLGMMEVVRHYESVIRLVQGYDEALRKAIQKLGDV